MLTKLRNLLKAKKGQALVEYGILVGAVAVVCLAATAVLGHKVNDLISVSAAVLPGAHSDDTGPIFSGKLVKTAQTGPGGSIVLDTSAGGAGSFSDNLGFDAEALVVDE